MMNPKEYTDEVLLYSFPGYESQKRKMASMEFAENNVAVDCSLRQKSDHKEAHAYF